jgi:leucyl-tRNA synthetase
MPGFAGSSGYYLRYMDPQNTNEYFSKEANQYWQNVDLYVGGAEHATGHLIYARFWNKFLFDLGLAVKDEPFQKMINQGMIQGVSELIFNMWTTESRHEEENYENVLNNLQFYNRFISADIIDRTMEELPMSPYPMSRHVDISITKNSQLNIDEFRKWMPEFDKYIFECEGGYWENGVFTRIREGSDKFYTKPVVEKMSKSKYNVVNPDDLVEKYGADTLRLYEMFLGPLELHKPWDTNGIEGVSRFVRKFWRLFHNSEHQFCVSDETPTNEELRILHKTIKKIQEDIEKFSFNTAVSTFMICVNDLTDLKCNKTAVLKDLVVLMAPFAPHIAEELWSLMGSTGSVCDAPFPAYDEKYLVQSSFEYPVSFNGKMRFKIELPLDMPVAEIEKIVIESKESAKWLDGKPPRKIIVVPGKIVNVVI